MPGDKEGVLVNTIRRGNVPSLDEEKPKAVGSNSILS